MELFDILDKIKLLKTDIDELNTICTSDNYEFLCKIIDAQSKIKTISLNKFTEKHINFSGFIVNLEFFKNLSDVHYDIKKLIDICFHLAYCVYGTHDGPLSFSGEHVHIFLLKKYDIIMAFTKNDYKKISKLISDAEEINISDYKSSQIDINIMYIDGNGIVEDYINIDIGPDYGNYADDILRVVTDMPARFNVNTNEFDDFIIQLERLGDIIFINHYSYCGYNICNSTAWKKFIGINKIFDNIQALKLFHLHIDKKIELQEIYEKYGTDIQIINNLNSQYKKKQNSIMAIDNI